MSDVGYDLDMVGAHPLTPCQQAALDAALTYGHAVNARVAGVNDLPAFLGIQDALFRACIALANEHVKADERRGEMAVYDVLDEDIDHEE